MVVITTLNNWFFKRTFKAESKTVEEENNPIVVSMCGKKSYRIALGHVISKQTLTSILLHAVAVILTRLNDDTRLCVSRMADNCTYTCPEL